MIKILGLFIAASGLVAGCATVPKNSAERSALHAQADATIQDMVARDPSLRTTLNRSVGYVVFPSIGQGGFIVGGASGRGVVYEYGRPIGFARLSQASVGALAGGQTYSELVVFNDRTAFDRMRAGRLTFGADTSAVMINTGAAASARFANGYSVFVHPRGGAMLNLSLTGQRIRFHG
jgi:lipid-binding SYLF domain-containing protein